MLALALWTVPPTWGDLCVLFLHPPFPFLILVDRVSGAPPHRTSHWPWQRPPEPPKSNLAMVCLAACHYKRQMGLSRDVKLLEHTEAAKQNCIFFSEQVLLFRTWTGSGRNIGSLPTKTREDEEGSDEEENFELTQTEREVKVWYMDSNSWWKLQKIPQTKNPRTVLGAQLLEYRRNVGKRVETRRRVESNSDLDQSFRWLVTVPAPFLPIFSTNCLCPSGETIEWVWRFSLFFLFGNFVK